MKIRILSLVASVAVSVGLTTPTVSAASVNWPEKTVKVIVPFNPGSTPDVVARLVSEQISTKTGQNFVVENRAGTAGIVGANAVAKSEPDGYTIGVGSVGPLANNPLLYANMPYDPFTDLAPITKAVKLPSVLVVRADFPAKNMDEFIEEVGRNPERYSYASVGNGSLSHLTVELLSQRKNLKIKHIPYAGGPQMMGAILGGHVDMTVMPYQTVKAMVADGRLRVLSAATPSKYLPDIKSFTEQGLGSFNADSWFGFFAPAGVPSEVLEEIRVQIGEALRAPSVAKVLQGNLMEVVNDSPSEFRQALLDEQAMWKPVVDTLGLEKQ